MEDKVLDVPVFVVAGVWDFSDNGFWEFVIAKECYGRMISMSSTMTYEELIRTVRLEFDLGSLNRKPKLSYWLPSQLSVFSINSRPPVIISSKMGIKNFLDMKKTVVHMNLMLSLEGVSDDVAGLAMRKSCGEDKGKGVAESGDLDYLSTVRRRLFDGSGGSGVTLNDKGMSSHGKELRDQGMSPPIATNDTCIIRLADAGTPSLTDNVAETDDDEYLLREVESFEQRQCEELKSKGKEKEKGYESGEDDTSVGSFLDGSGDTLLDDDNWTDLLDSQYPAQWPQAWLEGDCSTGPASGERVRNREGEDIGEAVLLYLERNREAASDAVDESEGEAATDSVHEGEAATDDPPESPQTVADEIGAQPDYIGGDDADPVFDDGDELSNPVSDGEDAIYVGSIFKDKDSLANALSLYAIKHMFHYKRDKSDTRRFIAVCVDQNCAWRVFARTISPHSSNFEIRTVRLTHTCSVAARSQYGKQASAKLIAEVLKGKYANGMAGPRAAEIPNIILSELKVSVTYMKAWYAKEAALIKARGSDESSYQLLAVYMHLLQRGNPGTLYKLEYTGGGEISKRFKYLFFALGASIAGVKYMRKVVLVDGTAIKAKFKGVLMVACMQDANFQVYPLAFGIVDAENDAAWAWFFSQLTLILPDAEDLVIVSDRHRSIYAGVRTVYPKAFHGACAVHIERNVKSKFPGKGVSNLAGKAARAFNIGTFNDLFAEIKKRNKNCGDYLDTIPLNHWTQAHCETKRYNIMSSNIAESWNNVTRKIVELPIVTMVDSIRTKLMEWFCIRRAKAKKWSTLADPITKNVNKYMMRIQRDSAGLAVKGVSAWSYQVSGGTDEFSSQVRTYYVDLEQKTCTCQQFQKLLIPCRHAFAAARTTNVYIPSLVGDVYRVSVFADSYAELIFPVPNQSDEEVPVDVVETQFIPPANMPGPGRRRKRRIPSIGENMGRKRVRNGPRRCSTCHERGHNRATCSKIPG